MVAPSKPVQQLTPFGHALAGALGGVFSNAVVYPLDTVKTRIQAAAPSTKDRKGKGKDGSAQPSVASLLLRILKEEGVGGYYKGFAASMLNTFSMQYAYFFFYSFVRTSYMKRVIRSLPPGAKPPSLSTAVELLLGAVAGALAQIFTIPVSVIATRQQIGRTRKQKPGDLEVNARDDGDGFFAVGREIIREDGVGGLWLGIKPGLVLTVNPAITYGVFERVKSVVLLGDTTAKLGPWKAFLVGAFSKTLATIITYPYIMAKVRVQAKTTDDEELLPVPGAAPKVKAHKPSGALDILAKVWKQEGFLGWYQGMGAQITKAVLSQALLFMLKDQFEQYALWIMILYRKLLAGL